MVVSAKGGEMCWKRITALALILSYTSSVALADCTDIPSAKAQDDRTLLWRDSGKWRAVRELNENLGKTKKKTIVFAYIVKDQDVVNPRKGVVVIKSGFTKSDSSRPSEFDTVALYRPWTMDPCRKRPYKEIRGRVSNRSYEDYHAGDARTDDDDLYSKFHIEYDSKLGCRYTNDVSEDAYFELRKRSNRSQFSFDPARVKTGSLSHIVSWFRIRPAVADEPVAGRTVQIRKYVANDGMACVRFRVTVAPGAFVRVNDLENRTLLGDDGTAWNRE